MSLCSFVCMQFPENIHNYCWYNIDINGLPEVRLGFKTQFYPIFDINAKIAVFMFDTKIVVNIETTPLPDTNEIHR